MYCHYIGWCIRKYIQRCPLFRVSFIRGSTVLVLYLSCTCMHLYMYIQYLVVSDGWLVVVHVVMCDSCEKSEGVWSE